MADPQNGRLFNGWSPFKLITTVICTILGGTGLYFTTYLWASARQTEANTGKICTVETLAKENKLELKDNAKKDQETHDEVIEIKSDIKNILSIVREIKRDRSIHDNRH